MDNKSNPVEVNHTCESCGKVFTIIKPYRISERHPYKFCSVACTLIARRRPKVVMACVTCGKSVELSPWQVKRLQKGPFCSHPCYGIWRSSYLAGSNSPVWKGGTDVQYQSLWKKARVDAKKRDSYRCVGCSRTSSGRSNRLDVHHIIPYGAFEDLVKAHDLSNLVTLCRRCHYMVHNELASVKLVDGSFVWVSKI